MNPRAKLGLTISLVMIGALSSWARAEAPPGRYEIASETVRDTRTTLMWQQVVPGSGYRWEDAKAHCEALELAGFSDWRLPNRAELGSLVDYTRVKPAIDPVAFPNTPPLWTWSSSGKDGRAWVIYFETGAAGQEPTDADPDAGRDFVRAMVRCVR